MAIKPDYQAGTASITAGTTALVGAGGANWVAADIQPGDTFKVQNLDAIVASVNSATSITLAAPWTGSTLSAAPYRIRYQPDGSRFTAALRDLVTAIGGGSLAALQAVTGAANKIPYFTSATTMALADFKAWALSFLSLTPAANKGVYFTDANTAALFDLTPAGRGLVGATSALAQLAVLGLPEQLAANRTYYVRKDGNDANTGLADNAAGAFLTAGRAFSAIYNSTDSRTFSNSVIVRAGTYSEGINLTGLPANSGSRTALRYPIFLIGDTATPTNVVIDGGGSHCVFVSGGARLDIHGFKLAPVNPASNAYCISTIDAGTQVNYGNLNFGATNVDHVTSTGGSVVLFDANYTISGGALNHWHATEGGMIKSTGSPITITLLGTPNFPGQFAGCASSNIFCPSVTFVGSATGRRFLTHHGGIIRTGTDNKNYLPGSIPGIQAAGGQYDYPPSFNVHKNFTDQTGVAGGVDVLVQFPNGSVIGGGYDATPANSSYQPRGGKCMLSAQVTFIAGCSDQNIMGIGIYKNGTPYKYSWAAQSGTGVQGIGITMIDDCNGDDVYQVYTRCDGAGTRTISGAPSYTWWNGSQIS